ncbi:alpha/beta hydrolase [Mucilaginibacter jinjuensis]|uniref:Alpha/beta hydrolase n=1 Tax=Mucilaginibacter jinjuensis TaxID=1176721 RepID=A0ABY7TBI5_9SPHI|nr:alpha/beta hydrolase [Mucilaginibacter jinjuensis]WCT13875.1 alpha/beta hydrolase [Mucilaginibacter jinjuensis]
MKTRLLVSLLMFIACYANAQQKVIQLYNGAAPGSESWNWEEGVSEHNAANTRKVYNVVHPTLSIFLPDAAIATGTAVVICPGGSFQTLSIDNEGFEEAKWFNAHGVAAFVLKYRVIHSLTNDPVQEVLANRGTKSNAEAVAQVLPLAIADARLAISYVRKHAAEYKLSPSRIGIMGFSAGGTLAAASAYKYTAANRPNFVALLYPFFPPALQSEILADAPPMFIAAATDDDLGLAPHSVDIYQKWVASKHTAELHIYAKGKHGFGMRKQNLPTDNWIERFGEWLGLEGFLKL